MILTKTAGRVQHNVVGALKEAQEIAKAQNWTTKFHVARALELGNQEERDAALRFLELGRDIPSGVTVCELQKGLKNSAR